MMTIIGFIIIIYLFVRNNDLKTENRSLKNQLAKQKEKTLLLEAEMNMNSVDITTKEEPNTVQIDKEKIESSEIFTEKKVETKVKDKKYSDQELKNTLILSVGAILVILSAIIFLTTTWNTSLNIIKTLVILLMFLVFLGSSYIADKYLNIKQTSKIFLYLAFSYLPLVFLSISLFELLGHYLSFFGPGKYVYLALSTIILSIIYYYYMIRNKDIFFAIGSIIFQVFSVILLVLIFTTNINIILFGISIYALLLNTLYLKNKYYFNEKIHLTISQTITISLTIITLYSSFLFKKLLSIDIYHILLLISLYFNIYFIIIKNENTKEYINIASPIMILYIFINIAKLINHGFIGYQLVLLIGIIINYLIELISSKDISIENYVINSIVLMLIYLLTFTQNNIIPSYLILLLQILITIYKKVLSENSDLDYYISVAISIEILNIIYSLNINTLFLPIIYLIIFLGSSLVKNEKLKLAFREISVIFTFIGFIFSIYNNNQYMSLMIISLITTVVYFLHYIKTNNIIIKYISYIWLIIAINYITMTINPNTENLLYSFSISSIITYLIDKYLSQKENNWYEFILTELLITFLCLAFSTLSFTILLFPLITIIFILYNKEWQKTDYLNMAPILSFYFYIINNNNYEFNYYTVISYLIPFCLLVYLYNTKKKEYILLSLVSTISAIVVFPENLYLIVISLLSCAIIYYFIDNDNKKIYLSSIYILLTILAKKIIYDLNLTNITVLNIGIFTAPLILITRTIMSKEKSDYKTIEYIGLIFIYSLAIPKYSGEPDGMLFVLLLLVLTIVSYNKKYGPVFLTSLCFILVNVFLLTRTFWLSIPWWIYILFVGSTLIAFSIRNEISEKNKKESLIKEVSKKLDL